MKQRFLSLWHALPSRRRKQMVWGLSLVLFYTIFGFFILPLIVKAVAISQLSKQLEREVKIRQVKINPYVLSGTIRGLLVKDKDGQPFLSVEEAYANFQLSSFFGKPWVFKDIWTVKPYCRVQINKDYSFNFSDLATKFSRPSPKPKRPSKPLYLHIGRLQIMGASASFADLTLAAPFYRLIGPVQITLTDFQTDPNNQNPYSFSGTTDGGEKFAWSGQFSLDPLQSAGELSLEGLSIPKYAPLFQDAVRFEIKDGVVDGRATYRFAFSGPNYLASVTNLSGSLRNLKVTQRGGAENLIELDEVSVAGISADTAARTAEVGLIGMAGGRIIAKRNRDESINLLQLAESPPEKAAAAPGGGILFLMRAATNAFAALVNSTNFWSATIHNVDVTNCEVHWADEATTRPVSLSVDQIAVSARHLSNVAGSNQTASFSLRWNTNGTAQVGAIVQISPPGADVTMNVTNLELKPLDPYLEPFVNVFLTDSKLGLATGLHMQLGSNDLPEVTFKGDAQLDDFAVVDAQTEELLKWKSVQVNGIEAGLQPPGVAAKQIRIVEPFARVAFDTNQNLNLLAILKPSPTNTGSSAVAIAGAMPARQMSPTGFATPVAGSSPTAVHQSLGQKLGSILKQVLAPTTNSAGAATTPKVAVETISITNGFIQFNDRSVQPPVLTSIEEVNGTILGVSTEELKRADVHIQAKAARTGPIEITGKINPLSQTAPTELTVLFRDVDLTPTSPYSGKFLGYRLNRGRLGLQVDYQVSQRQLKAKNLVTLDQLTLGEKVQSPDATKLPVKLALALLKDRNGNIEIDLPIEGNLDDPEFHYGKVILHVLVNLMTKMITSPFAALGSLFGGKGEEVSFQDFEPGSAQLQAAHAQKLDALINGLYERPGLELQIEGSFDPSADGYALRKQRLIGKFRQQKWSVLRKSEQDRIPPDQVPFSIEEYAAYLDVAYRGAIAAGVWTNSMGTNSAAGKTGAAAAQAVAVPSAASGEKGATSLLQKTMPAPDTGVQEKERIVLSTVKITDDELARLAEQRSQNVRQRIIDSGKVEAARLSILAVGGQDATNRASRVYFHLE